MAEVTLPNDSFAYGELERKYNDFMAPTAKVRVDGKDVEAEGMALGTVRVDMSALAESDAAVFSIMNAYDMVDRRFRWLDKFKLGGTVEVDLGYMDKLTTVYFGYITSIRHDFPPESPPQLIVTAMDASFKMMRGHKAKTWTNQKVSDVVKQIAADYGIQTAEVDDTGAKLPTIAKNNISDFNFLRNLALSLNYEFFVVGKKLYFRKKIGDKSFGLTLKYLSTLRSLLLDHSLSEQVTKVEVRGWDAAQKKPIVGTSSGGSFNKTGGGSKTGPDLLKAAFMELPETIYANVSSQDEATKLANAIWNERGLRFVQGEGECVGVPELRAGRFIKLEGLSPELDQAYYVVRAVHTLDTSGYRTQFQIQGNVV